MRGGMAETPAGRLRRVIMYWLHDSRFKDLSEIILIALSPLPGLSIRYFARYSACCSHVPTWRVKFSPDICLNKISDKTSIIIRSKQPDILGDSRGARGGEEAASSSIKFKWTFLFGRKNRSIAVVRRLHLKFHALHACHTRYTPGIRN